MQGRTNGLPKLKALSRYLHIAILSTDVHSVSRRDNVPVSFSIAIAHSTSGQEGKPYTIPLYPMHKFWDMPIKISFT